MISHFNRVVLLAACLIAVPYSAARAQDGIRTVNSKIDRDLRQSLQTGGMKRVIVSVKPGYRQQVRQALRAHGDAILYDAAFIDALAGDLHAEDIQTLSEHPWIEAISADATVYAGGSQRYGRPQWARDAEAAASTLRETLGLTGPIGNAPTGRGVGVAIVDSGIAPVVELEGRISAFFEVTPKGVVVATHPKDPFGHGTHIAGLIGGNGQTSGGVTLGVAPDVHLVGIKVLDRNGAGTTSDVIRAIDFLVERKDVLDVQVVNLSLGHSILAPAKDDPLVRAVERATQAGLIVIVSAGNRGFNAEAGVSGYAGITSPGNAPSAITVGAAVTYDTVTRSDDEVASYSSRGPTWFDAHAKPDIVAPGHQLTSSARRSSVLFAALGEGPGTSGGDTVLQLSGTSMAAGVTSGVVALLLEANEAAGSKRTLSANAVKAILQVTAIPVADADLLTQGTGQVNAEGGIRLARAINLSVPVSTWWLGAHPGAEASVIGSESLSWSSKVIWGDGLFDGDVLHYNLMQWSDQVLWGAKAEDNIIWGTALEDNIIWGTVETWGPSLAESDRVLGLRFGDNIIWGTALGDNIIWGTALGDNIIWGTALGDNIIWGTALGDNIIWGTALGDNIIWGTALGDNIIWGTALPMNEAF